MRAIGVVLLVLVAGCGFGWPTSGSTGDAPADDGTRGDGPRTDGPSVDSPPGAARRKQITIDPARVTGSHAAFPVWIVLASDSNLSMRATASGADIHFTRPDGAPLAYQIPRWSQAAGRLEAWIRADLEDNLPTVIELRYGDPGAAHAPSPPAVFSSSFAAVWHLDDPLNNTTIADATSQRTGTTLGGISPADQVPARLGGGVDFDGNDDRIQFTNPFTGTGDHTISAWVNQRTASGFDDIVTVGNPQVNASRWFRSHYLDGVSAGFYGNDMPGSVADIDNAGWVLLHWTWIGSNRRSRIYRDGVVVDDRTLGPGINTQGAVGHLGYAPIQWGPGGNTSCALNGILDEVRLATVERSAGWIATEFANQSAPQQFYTVGAEQPVP